MNYFTLSRNDVSHELSSYKAEISLQNNYADPNK